MPVRGRTKADIEEELITAIREANTKPWSLERLARMLEEGPHVERDPLGLFEHIDELFTTGSDGVLKTKEYNDLAQVRRLYREYKSVLGADFTGPGGSGRFDQ